MKKLHLGCGNRYIPGFIHIDVKDYDHVDHVCDIGDLDMFDSDTIDLIYCSHVLEHFKRDEVFRVLTHWYDLLKSNGILRLSVPNFKVLAGIYLKSENLSLVIGPLMGRQDDEYNIHYNIFDEKSLSDLLFQIGFKEVKRYNWRETEHANVDDFSSAYIPHMDKENGILISLNLEAIK